MERDPNRVAQALKARPLYLIRDRYGLDRQIAWRSPGGASVVGACTVDDATGHQRPIDTKHHRRNTVVGSFWNISGIGEQTSCDRSLLVAELARADGLGRTPLTVLAKFTYGPRILYRTPHSVIATPYHRNARGQIDAYRIYSATDLEDARRLIEERGIDIIVTCRAGEIYAGLSGAPDMLETRLRRGEAPKWLSPVRLTSEAAAQYRIYRIFRSES
jgi:hypothetical protein